MTLSRTSLIVIANISLCPTEYVMLCAIWYHLYNLKNVKNTHGEVLLLVKLLAEPATLLKVTFFQGCFSSFLNCTYRTKSRKVSHIVGYVVLLRLAS